MCEFFNVFYAGRAFKTAVDVYACHLWIHSLDDGVDIIRTDTATDQIWVGEGLIVKQ